MQPVDPRALLLPRLRRPEPGRPGTVIVPSLLEAGLVLETTAGEIDVGWEDLEAWGLSFEEGWEAALETLRVRSTPSRWSPVATVPGMQIYLPGGADAASRALLLPELLEPFPIEGALFAVPERDQLLVVPLHDFAHLSAVQVLVSAAQVATRSTRRPLTDQLFWTDGDRIAHVRVTHRGEETDVVPPPGFLEAAERLATGALAPRVAEA